MWKVRLAQKLSLKWQRDILSTQCLLVYYQQKNISQFYTCDNLIVTGAKLQYHYNLGKSCQKNKNNRSALSFNVSPMSFCTSQPHCCLWGVCQGELYILLQDLERLNVSNGDGPLVVCPCCLVLLDRRSGRCRFRTTGFVTLCWGDNTFWRMSVNCCKRVTSCCFSHLQISWRATLKWL